MGDFPLSRPSQKSYGVHSRDLAASFAVRNVSVKALSSDNGVVAV